MRLNDEFIDRREAERQYVEFINYNGFIPFDEFMECEYEGINFYDDEFDNYEEEQEHYNWATTFDFDSVNVKPSNNKKNKR